MKVAVVKIKAEPWERHLRKLQRQSTLRGTTFKELPMNVWYGGTIYEFTPKCELPIHTALGLIKRRGWLVEMVHIKEAPKQAKELDRANLEQAFLCSFCNRPFETSQGRNVHESRHCKAKKE